MSRPEPIQRDDGPAFTAPWQTQAFAMTVQLNEAGLFSWAEWTQTLGSEIAKGSDAKALDATDAYYRHWLAALETVLTEKGVIASGERLERIAAWDRAARATPHGEPIVLGAEQKN
ncbi:MAG: nitrile hydratase accessory protein [Pseudomonadota bacterium]